MDSDKNERRGSAVMDVAEPSPGRRHPKPEEERPQAPSLWGRVRRWLFPPLRSDYAAAGDFLRAFAVFMVAWYHIWQQSWLYPAFTVFGTRIDAMPAVRPGYMFVDLMLVLSGFLLYLPYARDRQRSTGEFFLRRALRILPSYWLCLAVMLIFAVTDPNFVDAPRLQKDLLAHLTFTQDMFWYAYTQTRLNVVLWTLAVEVQFYLLLPALAPLFRRRPLVTYGAMVAIAMCFRYTWTLPMSDTTLYVNRLPNMLDVYANGMLAAHVYARLAKRKKLRAVIVLLGTAAAALAAWQILRLLSAQSRIGDYELLRRGQLQRRWLLSACGGVFLLGGSLSAGPIRALLSNPLIRFLSGISFNFYIWHQWLAVKLKQWRIPPYQAAADPQRLGEMPWQRHYTLLCFAAAFVAAVMVTWLVEKPCARLGMKAWRRVRKWRKKRLETRLKA